MGGDIPVVVGVLSMPLYGAEDVALAKDKPDGDCGAGEILSRGKTLFTILCGRRVDGNCV